MKERFLLLTLLMSSTMYAAVEGGSVPLAVVAQRNSQDGSFGGINMMVLAASPVSLPPEPLSKVHDSSKQKHAEGAGQRAAANVQLKQSNCPKKPKKNINGARNQASRTTGGNGSMSRQEQRRRQK